MSEATTVRNALFGQLPAGFVRVLVQKVALQQKVDSHLIDAADWFVRALLWKGKTQV